MSLPIPLKQYVKATIMDLICKIMLKVSVCHPLKQDIEGYKNDGLILKTMYIKALNLPPLKTIYHVKRHVSSSWLQPFADFVGVRWKATSFCVTAWLRTNIKAEVPAGYHSSESQSPRHCLSVVFWPWLRETSRNQMHPLGIPRSHYIILCNHSKKHSMEKPSWPLASGDSGSDRSNQESSQGKTIQSDSTRKLWKLKQNSTVN